MSVTTKSDCETAHNELKQYPSNIKGFDRYSVDKSGNVMSLYFKSRTGKLMKRSHPLILKKALDNYGYSVVTLYSETDKRTCKVHRLVSMAFLQNKKGKAQVNHKNGVKTDNRLSNLEWATASENILHSYHVLGTKPPCHWTGKENKKLQKPLGIFTKKGGLLESFKSQKSIVSSGFCSKSSVTKCLDANKTIKGFYLKTINPNDREAYALGVQ